MEAIVCTVQDTNVYPAVCRPTAKGSCSVANCRECADANTCAVCGHSHALVAGHCEPCPAGCTRCQAGSSTGLPPYGIQCTKCRPNFGFDPDGTCWPQRGDYACFDPNCGRCQDPYSCHPDHCSMDWQRNERMSLVGLMAVNYLV